MVFNTSLDASMVTRLHDWKIINVNQGFLSASGFTPEGSDGMAYGTTINIHGTPHIVSIARDLSDGKIMEENLKTIPITDEHTGLYKRGFFVLVEQYFKVVNRTKSKLLLFSIDLDKMKFINDIYGHK